jgi:cell division protein FtsW
MAIVMRIDYHLWRRYSIAAMVVVLVMLLAVILLPVSIAPIISGAKRWINVFSDSWQLQPSELAKIALILYAAHWLSSKGDKVRNFYYGLMPFALTLGFLIALIMGEPDLGTSMVIGTIGLVMFFVAGANILHLMAGLALASGSFMALALTAAYRLDRFKAYFNPFADPNNSNYHIREALMGLGSGGIFGRGLGMSQQKFFWLPTVFTDSIFAIVGEELGLVGASVIVILFVIFAWRGFQIAFHAPDGFGRLIATGITVYIVGQAFLNIAVITNTVPFTGVPLPFISYGGSSLAVTLIALGLLLNVSRQTVADPHQVELEELRRQERQSRSEARQRREEERTRKQLEHERQLELERREAEELAQRRAAWELKQRKEREAEYVRSELERARQARLYETKQDQWEQAEVVVTPKAKTGPKAKVKAEEQAEVLPGPAAVSYLAYQRPQSKLRLESTVKAEEDQLSYKPKSRRPRRDWAKTYDQAHHSRQHEEK